LCYRACSWVFLRDDMSLSISGIQVLGLPPSWCTPSLPFVFNIQHNHYSLLGYCSQQWLHLHSVFSRLVLVTNNYQLSV
jgi:hypothetical protein